MGESNRRPSFTAAWLSDLMQDVHLYGPRKLIPIVAIFCVIIGFGISFGISDQLFWTKIEVVVAFMAVQVTVNGLLLGLSWGSFGKIYEIASRPNVAAYLRRNNLLNTYIFHVDFIHVTQVVALACSSLALIVSLFDKMPAFAGAFVTIATFQKIVFAVSIASSVYALRYSLGAVRIMQDLVWYSSQLSSSTQSVPFSVQDGGKNV